MATVDPTINDTLTNVQLRQIRQKLEEEKRRRGNQEQNADLNGSNIKLLQAVLERQELLNKLQQEQKLRDDLIRPASYNDKPARSTSPRMTQRRSESQPVLLQTYDTTGPRQVVEHQFKPIRLEPLENPPKPPAILQTSLPTPYLVNVPPPQQNTKAEMMEMMMLQNAQMHQMIMNQLMIQAMPKPPQDAANTKRVVEADDVIIRKRASPVHYYEATPRVQQQPVYTLPPVAPVPVAYPTPRYYPMELEPLKYPREHQSYLHEQYYRANRSSRQNRHRHRPDSRDTHYTT